LAGGDLAGNLTCKTPCFAQRSLKCCHAFFRQGLTTLKERAIRTDALPRKLEGALLVCHEPCNLLLGQIKLRPHKRGCDVADTGAVFTGGANKKLSAGYRFEDGFDLAALLEGYRSSGVVAH
jgi:hypothetical protein